MDTSGKGKAIQDNVLLYLKKSSEQSKGSNSGRCGLVHKDAQPGKKRRF